MLKTSNIINEIINNPALNRIYNYQYDFNPLKVFNIDRDELVHSDFLSYFLSYNSNSGLKCFIELLKDISIPLPEPLFEKDHIKQARIYREIHHIDLLIAFDSLNYIIAIENKIDSEEGENQIKRYQDTLLSKFNNYNSIIIFLTPDGRISFTAYTNHKVRCFSLSYQHIILTIEKYLPNNNDDFAKFCYMIKKHIEVNIVNDIDDQKDIFKLWGSPEIRKKLSIIYKNKPSLSDVKNEFIRKTIPVFEKYNDKLEIEFYPDREPYREIKVSSSILLKKRLPIYFMLYDYDRYDVPALRVVVWEEDFNKNKKRLNDAANILNYNGIYTEYKKIKGWRWLSVHQKDPNVPDFVFDFEHDYSETFINIAVDQIKKYYLLYAKYLLLK